MILSEGSLVVRHLAEADAPLLVRWLSDPRVLEFYEGRDRPHDLAMVRQMFLAEPPGPETRGIVEHEGRAIGYIQFYPLGAEEQAEYGYGQAAAIYGLDLFIGEPDCWNRCLGTRLVSAVLAHLFAAHGAEQVVVDPQAGNARAIRCYEKAGFRKVRLLEAHEWHEGALRDCWLMECVPSCATAG